MEVDMAHYYPKIYAPFKRDDSKSKYVNVNSWATPEFELLQNIDWIWTQKADGTSVVLQWNGDKMTLDTIKGHTDRSQFNQRTKDYLEKTFCTPEAESVFESLYGEHPVNVYGEFCSKDMNQNYGFPDGIFYPFDVQNAETGKWWPRLAVDTFAEEFCLQAVPIIFTGTIKQAVEYVKNVEYIWNKNFSEQGTIINHQEVWYKNHLKTGDSEKYLVEGLVGRPKYELLNANSERIITKIKCKDFNFGGVK